MTDKPFYTVDELAQRWDVSPRFVRRLVAEQRIGVTRLGTHIRFALRDVQAFEKAGRQEPAPVHPLLSRPVRSLLSPSVPTCS